MTSSTRTLLWSDAFGDVGRLQISRHLLKEDNRAHAHDFMELAIILGGAGKHLSDRGEVQFSGGDTVLLRPGTWHAYLDCRDLDVLNFCFPLPLARDGWRHMLSSDVQSLLWAREDLRLTRLPNPVVAALATIEPMSRRDSGNLGLLLWVLDQVAMTVPRQPNLHSAVERAIRCFEEQIDEHWVMESVAEAVGLDKAYLSRLFKAQVGVGPMAYLAVLRAERAASLLRNTALNCGEVGFAVGYSDANLFSRRFRARFGLSPTAYRKRAVDAVVDSERSESGQSPPLTPIS